MIRNVIYILFFLGAYSIAMILFLASLGFISYFMRG